MSSVILYNVHRYYITDFLGGEFQKSSRSKDSLISYRDLIRNRNVEEKS